MREEIRLEIQRKIAEKFEQARVVQEKPKVTSEEAAEILFRVALRKLGR